MSLRNIEFLFFCALGITICQAAQTKGPARLKPTGTCTIEFCNNPCKIVFKESSGKINISEEPAHVFTNDVVQFYSPEGDWVVDFDAKGSQTPTSSKKHTGYKDETKSDRIRAKCKKKDAEDDCGCHFKYEATLTKGGTTFKADPMIIVEPGAGKRPKRKNARRSNY